MKITRVNAFAIGIGDVGEPKHFLHDDFQYSIYGTRHQTVIARVETDAGIVGFGEGQSPISPQTTKTIIDTALTPMLLGRDPLDTSALWTLLKRRPPAVRPRPTGIFAALVCHRTSDMSDTENPRLRDARHILRH